MPGRSDSTRSASSTPLSLGIIEIADHQVGSERLLREQLERVHRFFRRDDGVAVNRSIFVTIARTLGSSSTRRISSDPSSASCVGGQDDSPAALGDRQ